ncbi:hypothetical protein [Bradyrhizobium sp. McL0615]|uniref:hypothetical protein n=1 Tax=Bradyrhizobium sp. McL0615 TaxID=3415673 RepID=UPI003CF9D573
MSDETRTYKILSIDGGGIRGVFPAAVLAKLEDHLSSPIGSYFDLNRRHIDRRHHRDRPGSRAVGQGRPKAL